jgi:hypothetical protein
MVSAWPSVDSHRTTAQTATTGEGSGVVLHGSRCGDHVSLAISSSFIRRLWSRGNEN